LFDYKDGKLIRKATGKEAGGYDDKGYRRIRIDGKIYKTHRLVWLWHTGKMPDLYVDHINHKVDDNRIENLRLATHQENKRNSSKKGVTYRAKRDKWEATYCGKYVGLYLTKKDALVARALAEIADPQHLRTAL
jgi:hypothetical protein